MIDLIRKITLVSATLMIFFLGYLAFFKDTARHWRNFSKPQAASYSSLEQEESILKELDQQYQFYSYKPLDPSIFTKPNIFQRY